MWPTHWRRVRALQELALGLSASGRFEEALASVEEGLAKARSSRGMTRAGVVADMLHTRAAVLHAAGRLELAEASAREAIAVRRGLDAYAPELASRLSDSMELLANVLTDLRQFDEADVLSAEVVAMRRRLPWSEQARALMNRSAMLLESGREAEGLEVALDLLRRAVARPGSSGVSDATFVHGLSNLGVLLRRNGRWEEALAVGELAVVELRPRAQMGGMEALADLAVGLSNLSVMHLECGRADEAVAPGEEALAIREELTARSAEAFGPGLSESLNNHAVLLHKLERHEAAESTARRCVELRRELHAAQPGAYEPKLANALATHTEMLTCVGRAETAVATGREAIERFRALEAAKPGSHTLWLAGALDTYAEALESAEQHADAFATSKEAVVRARAAHEANPQGAGDVLAQILLACAERHAVRHRPGTADWAREAVDVLTALGVEQPEAHAVALHRATRVLADLTR